MSSFRYLRYVSSALVAALFAACGGGSSTISLSNYDTSCQVDSDCTAVVVGPIGCCSCPNAAINKADLAKYQVDFDATVHEQVCTVECGACFTQATVCSHGTCALATPTPVSCGTTTCPDGQVCVSNQTEGGAIIMADGGTCPSGRHDEGGLCQPDPTYQCAAAPAACGASLSCACAASLCAAPSMCQSASAGLVACVLLAP
jgi:hypothetical protein